MASAVNRALADVIADLQEQARKHSEEQERLLLSGRGSLDIMTYDEWKARHNLPAHWRATGAQVGFEGYPPDSDLYSGTFPAKKQERKEYFERRIEAGKQAIVYRCDKCKDAGWLRVPFDAITGYGPSLVRCDCEQ